ncbi:MULTISPECIES: NAD-dependent succinate-semialdehyde dehydrogenase [Rhizobium]|uniref:NAD-dependent succinate-semialdehyde dehydrogenase n=1 Tax=Rhizobium phaseoli TaxID=396 RepID=A0A192TCA7_9HYPH|nr:MULTISPECIES: NAD-dependent succinate-semialdehyde dehydrogenase [Rhizobium]ANL40613.1 succinate-semialdehyde dehydrogenase (NADP(+)) protein [Rhizobium phaseoli]ANL53348.1 succinate-semialdehyde dehydrogenase (NADP(+)) protein [Rhizobium phaseoli]ANL59601.1 succinate-semialdehyde dehydrogenase (NADP(+)) protein [Rhizobium phaseoli]ANL84994.1 succinate-semialdehyde dehydrogenase (NADP(+)) protein [Rhizobium phaseoli]ANL91502.1 succinate-semialdehyde dehydrogenase (NADP(+)) protein [Rhizobiu
MSAYPNTQLYINGRWRQGLNDDLTVVNPASGEVIGRVSNVGVADLDEALSAAAAGFEQWRRTSAFERAKLMHAAAEILRQRTTAISRIMTLEQGKPLAESKAEAAAAADIIDWFAEEARRAYGRLIPPRAANVRQMVVKEPVGPVAAFSPWNFPLNQAVRKVSAALAAGCSIILKGPEETPASCAELVRAFAEAGLPAGVLNLVFGIPADISNHLIPHPIIRKISFTGSTAVGKQLASLAGAHMKRVTMELGGHAPAIVFDDADIDLAVRLLAAAKFRNAGQVCVAPTRFLIQEPVFDKFLDGLVKAAEAINVGDGLSDGVTMGPLANARRVGAMEALTADAVMRGAKIATGGKRIGNLGNFFQPTVLTDVPQHARVLSEEPFGPLAIVSAFSDYNSAIAEANRLPYGLAAYAYTTSAKTSAALARDIESGMLSINHHGLALPELPFGGIKDSGYGSEGGSEAMESYLNTKLVTEAA